MSLENNYKAAEIIINKLRIQLKLRIFWPDFQIYDLLGDGMTFPQISHYSSFPPFIIPVDLTQKQLPFPLNSKEYTHIAITKKKEINQQMEVIETIYALLTKRNIAIDKIEWKYLHGKYRLEVQAAQLNRSYSLWGAEVISDQIRVISPKHICKRNSLWFIQYEFDQSIQSLIFYSVQRQPSYGKNCYYGKDLPKDVIKEMCLRYRTFDSIIDSHLKNSEQQSFHSLQNHQIFYSFKNLFIDQETKQKQIVQKVPLRQSNKISLSLSTKDEQGKQNRSQVIKIVSFQNQSQSVKQKKADRNVLLKQTVRQLQLLNKQFHDQLVAFLSIVNSSSLLYSQLNQQLSNIENWNDKSQEIKIQMISIAISRQCTESQNYLLTHLLLNYHNSLQKQLKTWIKYYDLGASISNRSLSQLSKHFLEHTLVMNCQPLLKDSDQLIPQLNRLLDCSLPSLIEQALALSQDNELVISDLIFVLMKLENKNNIFQLYQQHKLMNNNIILAESINHWIQQRGLPSNNIVDLCYCLGQQLSINMTQYIISECSQPQKNYCKNYNLLENDDCSKAFDIQIGKFTPNCLVSTKTFKIDDNQFTLFLFQQSNYLYSLLQQSNVLTHKEKRQPNYQSYKITIKMIINHQTHFHSFGWNFASPSHSAGWKFKLQQEDAVSIKCSFFMKKSIVHQSIMNFIKIRYAQMFKFPQQIVTKEDLTNKQNQKLIKRRSTLLLQHPLAYQLGYLDTNCFFHHQCQHCAHLLTQDNVYRLSPLDMYSILLGAPFKKQITSVLALLKYISLFEKELSNIDFFLSYLRMDYLQLADLLALFNRSMLESNSAKIFRKIIEDKLQLNIGSKQLREDKKRYFFRYKGRFLEDMRKFIETEYSQEYLQYVSQKKI